MPEGCTVETWTVKELSSAIQKGESGDKRKIKVPTFQRGMRWDSSQEASFIESLRSGFPVGSLLFYKKIEQNIETYILVDGLQRGNTIKKYINNAADFLEYKHISDEFCKNILQFFDKAGECDYDWLRSLLINYIIKYIKEHKSDSDVQFHKLANEVIKYFHFEADRETENQIEDELIEIFTKFYQDWKESRSRVASTKIPVIIYQGDEQKLPMIFDFINSKGTALTQYEVYAASWPEKPRFSISNENIINYVVKKYESFINEGYEIEKYDMVEMQKTKEVTAFEYLFGLSKYLVNTYEILHFEKKKEKPDDAVNPLGFELVDACLSDKNEINLLYDKIYNIKNEIDEFEHALCTAIDFVKNAIYPIIYFKGNKRKDKEDKEKSGTQPLHAKYQIMSMISATFKEMFVKGNYKEPSQEWGKIKDHLKKNLRYYYVYDIITNYWSDGGPGKVYSMSHNSRYISNLPLSAWRSAFDNFYETSMLRSEISRVKSPQNVDYVILNCIYLKKFSAEDQLYKDKNFDVEHIAPKAQMKKLITQTEGSGLPISSIANLCYLPQEANRVKQDNNFYQDDGYLEKLNLDLSELEIKYSFTTKSDLDWMDNEYHSKEDFSKLKQSYFDFCKEHFEKMKKAFCDSMDLNYDAMINIEEEIKGEEIKGIE